MGQDFFINKKSTLPVLKMELVNDGRNDFRNFHDKIQNATIKFTMWDLMLKESLTLTLSLN